MATWPHEETTLTEREKDAYRYLLYWAMLDIRSLCLSRGPADWNPIRIWRQYQRSRVAGSLADWLHNMAVYAANDFFGFDAEWFWREYDSHCRQYKRLGLYGYFDYLKFYADQLAKEDTQE